MVKDGGLYNVKAKKLKRLHESSAAWCQLDEFTLEDLMSEGRGSQRGSHPVAPARGVYPQRAHARGMTPPF